MDPTNWIAWRRRCRRVHGVQKASTFNQPQRTICLAQASARGVPGRAVGTPAVEEGGGSAVALCLCRLSTGREGLTVSKGFAERAPRIKGAKEQGFSEVLSGLGPASSALCSDLIANQAFYAIGMLAYNVLISLKVLDLPDDAQSWRIQSLIRHLLTLPVTVSAHARYGSGPHLHSIRLAAVVALVCGQWIPKRQSGRPVVEVVDSASGSAGQSTHFKLAPRARWKRCARAPGAASARTDSFPRSRDRKTPPKNLSRATLAPNSPFSD